MRPAAIKRLIELVEDSEIEILEVSSWGRRVKITRKQPSMNGSAPPVTNQALAPEPVVPTAPSVTNQPQTRTTETESQALTPQPSAEQVSQTDANLVEIKSPMVGTFYSSPSPESQPFVKIGDTVSEGTVVCIVEAMKLMNEIESEVTGKISRTLVENGQPIEFGQALFLVDISA